MGGFLEVFLGFREGREEHRQAWTMHLQQLCAEKGKRHLDAKGEDQGRSSGLKPEKLLGAAYLEMKVTLN